MRERVTLSPIRQRTGSGTAREDTEFTNNRVSSVEHRNIVGKKQTRIKIKARESSVGGMSSVQVTRYATNRQFLINTLIPIEGTEGKQKINVTKLATSLFVKL